ncbi:hypothetical protein CA984_24640 [Streptosporangium minutum]|uniref:Uncharacterized protein n=1 Tax=Streptosporangium minutum TaxID=569862 RepID=A0A243RGI9_9ACTN|nr:hypothetical protein CA984_24640 [Streptosporangium minutum]
MRAGPFPAGSWPPSCAAGRPSWTESSRDGPRPPEAARPPGGRPTSWRRPPPGRRIFHTLRSNDRDDRGV